MAKKHFVLAFWIAVIITGSVSAYEFTTVFYPNTFSFFNIQGIPTISINYNIPTTLNPFAYSPLTLVNAPTITCTFSTALLGITNSGQTIPLSVATVDDSPIHSFSLTSPQTGTIFTSFVVREGLYCPDVTNGAFPPNLVSGSVNLSWTATKKDGTSVSILTDSEAIQPKYTLGAGAISLPSGKAPLVGVTLYSWTVPESQVEAMLDVNPLGDDFTSLQNISITNTDTFYQGNVPSTPWTFTNIGPSMLSFNLHEITGNPLAFNGVKMTLAVTNPANAQMNIQNQQVVTLQGTVTNPGTTNINTPEVKLYYSDPTSPNQISPIADFFIKPDVVTNPSNANTYTYTFSYPFSQTAGLGQYTFAMSIPGLTQNTVKANVFLSSTAPPVCQPGYYVDATTFKCKISTTTQCPNGSIISSDQACPPTTPAPGTPPTCPAGQTYSATANQCQPSPSTSCPNNILACFSGINLGTITTSAVQTAIIIGAILLIIFIILVAGGAVYHHVDKNRGGEGVAPTQIINEEG